MQPCSLWPSDCVTSLLQHRAHWLWCSPCRVPPTMVQMTQPSQASLYMADKSLFPLARSSFLPFCSRADCLGHIPSVPALQGGARKLWKQSAVGGERHWTPHPCECCQSTLHSWTMVRGYTKTLLPHGLSKYSKWPLLILKSKIHG